MSEEIIEENAIAATELPGVIEALVVAYRDKWLSFVCRMVHNREDAEDVLQESALKMLIRQGCFRSQDEVRMYFSRVISNTAIEAYHRRRRCRLQYCTVYESALLPCDMPGAEVGMLGNDERRKIRVFALLQQGLKRLPVKQYEALRLTLMDPVAASIRDAGAEHSIPYSTLRHRRIQGLRRLKKFLLRELKPWAGESNPL